MFKPKIKINPALFEKIKTASEVRGASSLEEFVERIIETEVDKILKDSVAKNSAKRTVTEAEVEDITKKLQGLGYLE